MKKLLLLLLFILFFTLPTLVVAKRLLPSLSSASTGATSTGIKATVKFRTDRKAVIVTLSNLSTVKSVDYLLVYSTRGIAQSASGTILTADEDPVVRELLFGSCSHGVCRYDTGITNARLSITISYKNGQKVIKKYLLKV